LTFQEIENDIELSRKQVDIIFYYQILRHTQSIFIQNQDLEKRNRFNHAQANLTALYKGVRGKIIGCFAETIGGFNVTTKRTFFITKKYL